MSTTIATYDQDFESALALAEQWVAQAIVDIPAGFRRGSASGIDDAA